MKRTNCVIYYRKAENLLVMNLQVHSWEFQLQGWRKGCSCIAVIFSALLICSNFVIVASRRHKFAFYLPHTDVFIGWWFCKDWTTGAEYRVDCIIHTLIALKGCIYNADCVMSLSSACPQGWIKGSGHISRTLIPMNSFALYGKYSHFLPRKVNF